MEPSQPDPGGKTAPEKDSRRRQLPRASILLLSVIALFCGGFILVYAKSVILPILVAFFAMILLLPLVRWMQKKGLPIWVAVPLSLAGIAVLLLMMGLGFYANLKPMKEAVPRYKERATVLLTKGTAALQKMGVRGDVETLIEENTEKINEKLTSDAVVSFVTGGITSFMSFMGQCVLVLLILLFMLFEAARFHEKTEKAFGRNSAIFDTMASISRDVQVYVKWKTLLSLGTGALTTVICAIFGLDFPLFWGILAFGLNYIPNLGSIVASALPPMLALFQFDSPFVALGLLLCLIAMQNLIGSLLEPKLLGDSLSISPLLLLLSLVFWGFLWGVVGMILAVPIAVTIKIVCKHIEGLEPVSILFEA